MANQAAHRLRGSNALYLTIDDVPSAHTERVLDTLHRYGMKASLFVVGQWITPATRRLLVQAARDGHLLANHSWSHPRFSSLTPSELAHEIDLGDAALQRVLQEAGPQYVLTQRYFRFPYGDQGIVATSAGEETITNLPGVRRLLRARRYRTAWWSVNPADWLVPLGRRDIETVAAGMVKAKAGDVVLMHDGPHAADLLNRVLPAYSQRWSLRVLEG